MAARGVEMARRDDGRKPPAHTERLPPTRTRDVADIVAQNLKHLRKAQSLSLDQLAELSGVSRAMLGQIETAKSVPTVSLLWKIADALGVSIVSLIASQNRSGTVVLTKDQMTVLLSSEGRFRRRRLFPLGGIRGPEFYEVRIVPGHCEIADPLPPGTRANLVVVSGTLGITIGSEQSIKLSGGDAILFEADVAHAYENLDDTETVAFLIVSHNRATGT